MLDETRGYILVDPIKSPYNPIKIQKNPLNRHKKIMLFFVAHPVICQAYGDVLAVEDLSNASAKLKGPGW